MSLAPGVRLGPYEIIAPIGAGGMGEVYRARDPRLNRDVALKVLPETFAQDVDRLARFKREAQVLASLNHTHIAAIYGIEEAAGVNALVLELVEGPTLADRIAQGPIPLEEALPIARQIADALEEAHEHGIVHRDLKPANIKVTPEGTVKVLDFGLAKALDAGSTEQDPAYFSNSPTITSPAMATHAGIILGTAAYMSPEQAKGKVVDKRTDIWAFGCVLYEMLAGKPVFKGDDVSEVLAAILRDQPDWAGLPRETPAHIKELLDRCLEKDPKHRLRDIGDARIALDGTAHVGAPPLSSLEPTWFTRTMPWAVGVLVGAAVGAVAVWTATRQAPIPPAAVQRFAILLPSSAPLFSGTAAAARLALSPDGARLIYLAETNSRPLLYLRNLSGSDVQPLRGTENGSRPFFSPDGASVGFVALGNVMKLNLQGGTPVTVAAADGAATWTSDDQIVFVKNTSLGTTRLFAVPASGGTPRQLPERKGDPPYGWPSALPGGNAILFTMGVQGGVGQVAVMSLDTGEISILVESGLSSNVRYVSSGHIVYLQQNTLMAVPFDVRHLRTTGAPVAVVEAVRENMFAVSESGLLVFATGQGDSEGGMTLVWVDRSGLASPAVGERSTYLYPRLSPDGTKVAVGNGGAGSGDISVIDLARGGRILLTHGDRVQAGTLSPMIAWGPDTGHVTFSRSLSSNEFRLEQISADGTGDTRSLASHQNGLIQPGSWSRDGQLLAFYTGPQSGTDRDLHVWRVNEQKAESFLATKFREVAPRFSPDAHWIAYVSDTSGRDEVYVLRYPEKTGLMPVSTSGGKEPVWSVDGRELFFRNGNQMMSVAVDSGASLKLGPPRKLFEGDYRRDPSTSAAVPNYDVAKDGRFLMVQTSALQSQGTDLVVVANWGEELKKLAPAGR